MQNSMFRIYTEDVHRHRIHDAITRHTPNYTLIPAMGSWHGKPEDSLVVELFDVSRATAEAVAESIRMANNQNSVAIVELPVIHSPALPHAESYQEFFADSIR